jgi:hypothetical protein
MRCVAKRTVSALPGLIAGLAVLAAGNRAALAAVSLQITSSVTVSEQGQAGQICVTLSTGGAQVAGTQNDLVWDGNCATLPSVSSCQAAPSLNKQLQGGFPPQFDFTYRALILSLGDVDPIPTGVLYCCAFQSEAAPGECCNIGITRAGASDPKGNAIGVTGAGNATICTAKGERSGGRGPASAGNKQPLSASNDGSQPQGASAAEPAAPAASGSGAAGAAPAVAVLPGGGVRVPDVAPEVSIAPTPAAQLAPAAPAVAAPAAAATPRQPPIAPPSAPTLAANQPSSPPTAAPTAVPAINQTPTAAAPATLAPTVPTKAAAPAANANQAKAAERGGGWFGCQIGPANPTPTGGFVVLLAAVVAMRRGRRTRNHARQPNH